jgi:hypothetical protein
MFRKNKTGQHGKLMNKKQKQAWIENWTLFVLQGTIGHIQNIQYQAIRQGVFYAGDLHRIKHACRSLISDIKEEQQLRKDSNNLAKIGKDNENPNQL